jgi:hypothetical protein
VAKAFELPPALRKHRRILHWAVEGKKRYPIAPRGFLQQMEAAL